MFISAMQQISDYYENYVSPVPDFESDNQIKLSNGPSNISGPVILLDRTNRTDRNIKTEQTNPSTGHIRKFWPGGKIHANTEERTQPKQAE